MKNSILPDNLWYSILRILMHRQYIPVVVAGKRYTITTKLFCVNLAVTFGIIDRVQDYWNLPFTS